MIKRTCRSSRLAVGALISLTAIVALIGIGAETRSQPTLSVAVTPDAAWATIESVLASPRCMNCHPRGDRPTQGDTMRPHTVNVQRGANGMGVPAMRCSTCHQSSNQTLAGIPGAPHWQLAPLSMGWTRLASGALCRTIKDPNGNGGRTVTDLARHMTGDSLVLWAWEPGESRTPPPVPLDELASALDVWMNAGAPCPD
jgi:hypothetical protein